MGKHRTPTNILNLRGSFDKNPQRKRTGEPVPGGKVGPVPKYFSPDQKAAWRELLKLIPDGVAFNSDRWLIETLVCLMVEFRRDPGDFSAAKLGRLETMLARLGMTPADRSKVQILDAKAKQADPWDEL